MVVMVAIGGGAGEARAQPAQGDGQVEGGTSERDRRLSETYRQMLAEDPAQDYAFRRLLETAHAVGGLVGLIELYADEVTKNPKSYAALLVLGQLQRVADNPEDALTSWDKAAKVKPERAEPHLFAAGLHRNKRVWDQAFAAYDRALTLLRDRTQRQDAMRQAAETAVEAKLLDKARDYFDRLIKTEPGNVFLRMQEASTYGKMDQPALALDRWREVEKAAGGQIQNLVIAWREIAELESQLGRFAESEATWRRALAKLPTGHYERRTFLEGLVAIHRRQDRLRALVGELGKEAERDVEALIVLARVHEELAEDELALQRYREAQRRRPGDEDIRMSALRLLERTGTPEEILQAWVELVRAFPREPRYELKLAELYFQLAKPREAGELLKRVSRGHPQDPSVHVQVVDLWMRYGDKASKVEVESEYKILMRLEPDEPSHVISLGEYYWSIEDKPRALSTWQRLQKMGTKKGEGRFLYAEALADHELPQEALVELKAALDMAPENERYVRALALLHEKIGRRQDALAAWQKLLERHAGARRTTAATREAREHIIDLWDKDERLEVEIAGLSKRFASDPPEMAAGRFLAVALLRVGRVSEARAVYERLDELEPDDHETLTGLEEVYQRQSDTPRTMATLERLAKASPRAAVEYLHRAAELALSSGDDATTLKLAKQIVELAPAEASAHHRVGDLYARMGFRPEAAEAWRQALTLEPRNMPVRFKLASLYRDQGQSLREEQILTEIVREASDAAELMRAGRRLLQLALLSGRLTEVETTLRPLIESVSRPESRGRSTALRLVVDVYGHLAQAIRYGPPEDRERQLVELGERAQRPLIEALEDSDVGIRSRALEVLELTHPAAATAALGRLAQDGDQSGQLEAISALGRIGSSGAVQVLTRLAGSTVATTRELALWALGLSSSATAGQVLAERARRGPPRERLIAAMAIGYGRHEGTEAVALELAMDRASDVREAGLWAVGRLAVATAVPELAGRLSRATSAREARIAASGLANVGTEPARVGLVAALWTGNAYVTDALIWEALATWGADKQEGEFQREAMVAVNYRGLVAWERGTVAPVKPALYVDEVEVAARGRGDATEAALVEKRVAEVLTSVAVEPKRAMARAALEEADGRASTALGEALKKVRASSWGPFAAAMSGNDEVRDAWAPVIARWLEAGRLGLGPVVDGESLDALEALARQALVDRARQPARASGALALTVEVVRAKRGGGAQKWEVADLEPYARAPLADVRAMAARALASLGAAGGVKALDVLIPLLGDPSPLVRMATAAAIRDEKLVLSKANVMALVELTRDPLPEVGLTALAALRAQSPSGLAGLPAEVVEALEKHAPLHIERAIGASRAP